MTPTGPVLLPPAPRLDRALPAWSLPVSLVGLAILLVSTLPALVARRRLEAAERKTTEDIRVLESTGERLRRDRQAVLSDRFVLDRAVRELLEPGRRIALPAASRCPQPACPASDRLRARLPARLPPSFRAARPASRRTTAARCRAAHP